MHPLFLILPNILKHVYRKSWFHFLGRLYFCQLSPPNPAPASGLSIDLFPSRLCQPVAGQHRSHLSPLQHAENNLRCACAWMCVCVCECGGERTVINWNMQDPDAGGLKLALGEIGKLMLWVRRNPTWFSGTVNELGKDNGSLELGREMRTELGKWAEAVKKAVR